MELGDASYVVCVRVSSGEVIENRPSLTDEFGNVHVAVGSVFDTHGYLNEYGGRILMDLMNVGIHLSDVSLVPEFLCGTFYTVELDEFGDFGWVAHEFDVEPNDDGIIEMESWI